jgi:hypothetical protein
MINPFVTDICEHIDNVFKKNNLTINHNEVVNKFSHFIMNESLCERFSYFVDKLYAKTITESELIGFVNNVILSQLNEGFENPFVEDEDVDQIDFIDVYDDADVRDKDLYTVKRIALYDPKVTKQSFYKNHRMYAGRPFIKKDIIEECPVEIVDPMDLHAKSVRDRCFAIEYDKKKYGEPKEWMMNNGDDKIIYGMPYGNANLYRTTQNTEEANVDYEFDMDEGIIRFYAIKRIKPKDELVLLAIEE